MEFEIADITIYQGTDEDVDLHRVAFHFSPGERSLYTGADNTHGVVQRGGWLGIKTEPYNGWHSAHVISVTGQRGTNTAFEVNRNFHIPVEEDGWLWFPVSPQLVGNLTR